MMTLEVSLLRTSPTATGRNPPDFLMTAKRLAPNRNGATSSETLPAAMQLTSLVMAPKAAAPLPSPLPFASFKCSALSPEGPAAVPALKLLTAS